MRTAAECAARLEASELYQRREADAKHAATMARVSALWFLDERFRPRYWQEKERAR